MTKQHKSTHTLFSVFTTIELVIVAALFAAIVLPLALRLQALDRHDRLHGAYGPNGIDRLDRPELH